MSRRYRHRDGSWCDYPETKVTEQFNDISINYEILSGASTSTTNIAGSKNDAGKPRMELIPTEFIIEVAKALTFGAEKYGDDNFRKGIAYKRLLSAAKRHIEQELVGIDSDVESNLSHLAHAGASLAMYAFMKAHRPDLDDRYKYTNEEKKKIEEMMYGKKNNNT